VLFVFRGQFGEIRQWLGFNVFNKKFDTFPAFEKRYCAFGILQVVSENVQNLPLAA